MSGLIARTLHGLGERLPGRVGDATAIAIERLH
jgi:hypothetical protein